MLQVRRATLVAYLLPTLIVVALINLYPIFYTLNLSFTNSSTFHYSDYTYIGGTNYSYVISQVGKDFLQVLLLTAVYVVACVGIYVSLGLVTAMALNHPRLRLRGFWSNMLI